MSDDDWLWSGRGQPDPFERRVSDALRPLAHDRPAPPLPARRRPWLVAGGVALAAAALLALFLRPTGDVPWGITGPCGADCVLDPGEWMPTAASSLIVGDLGDLRTADGTRIRLLARDPGAHVFELLEGEVDIAVVAPPRELVVLTPAARVVDLGCAYRLLVRDGATVLRVRSGKVALEQGERSVFVPGGASATAIPGALGLPRFDDAPPAVHDAADRLERDPSDAAALSAMLAPARPVDTLTLWHLLARVDGAGRQALWSRIVELDPQLAAMDAEGVLAGDPDALEAARAELEFLWGFR